MQNINIIYFGWKGRRGVPYGAVHILVDGKLVEKIPGCRATEAMMMDLVKSRLLPFLQDIQPEESLPAWGKRKGVRVRLYQFRAKNKMQVVEFGLGKTRFPFERTEIENLKTRI
jgi:hypothetical protein